MSQLRRARAVGASAPRSQSDKRSARGLVLFIFLTAGARYGCGAHRAIADRPPVTGSAATTPASTVDAGIETPTDGQPPKADAVKPAVSKTNSSKSNGGVASRPVAARSAKAAAIPPPIGYSEQGNASWYGVPFNGRRASNGEIYDMYKLTAAHRTLPFETMVRVTNLNNGKATVVRITDRGPFVDNRVIDLSLAAAQEIESIGPGVVPVRLEIMTPGIDPNSGYFTVQVGAFRERGNAERLRERLSATYSPIFIQEYDAPTAAYYRVRVGKVSGEENARRLSQQLHARDNFDVFVMRLDENVAAGTK